MLETHPATKDIFVSIHASNTLPKRARTKKPCAYVSNTDKANQPGKHWTCFYFPNNSPPEYFDSFGLQPLWEFEKFLGRNYIKNTLMIQNPWSTSCGQHIIYFLIQRSKGRTMENIVSSFDKIDLGKNDKKVNSFVELTFNVDLPIFDSIFVGKQIAQSLKDRKPLRKPLKKL